VGSANFVFSKEFVVFGLLRQNLNASALNKNRFGRPAQFGKCGALPPLRLLQPSAFSLS
jgi:hypothetical protein